MTSVAPVGARPTNLAPLPRLLALHPGAGPGAPPVARQARHPDPGAGAGLAGAGLARDRPARAADRLDEPLLAALLGRARLPCGADAAAEPGRTSRRTACARRSRPPIGPSCRAATGRVWAALDAHQVPYWGRGKPDALLQGLVGQPQPPPARLPALPGDRHRHRPGHHLPAGPRAAPRDDRLLAVLARRVRRLLGRRLAGVVADCGFTSRASVAALVDAEGPVHPRLRPLRAGPRPAGRPVRPAAPLAARRRARSDLGACAWDARLRLFALGARSPTDKRGPWVYVTSLRARRAETLAAHLSPALAGRAGHRGVAQRPGPRPPGRLSPAPQPRRHRLAPAGPQPGHRPPDPRRRRPARRIREPAAFRAAHVDGLGTFAPDDRDPRALLLARHRPTEAAVYSLPWTDRIVRLVA